MSSVGATDLGVAVSARSRDPGYGVRRQEHCADDPFPLPSVFGRRSRDERLRLGDDRGQPINSGQQLLFCKRPLDLFCFRTRRPWFDLKYDFVLF